MATEGISMVSTSEPDSGAAAHILCDALLAEEPGLVVFFCSPRHDRAALARVLNERAPSLPVIGCTTAGEIGDEGYLEGGLSGFAIARRWCVARFARIDNLQEFSLGVGLSAAQSLLGEFEAQGIECTESDSFVLSLIDGLSVREEPVVRAFHSVLGGIPLIGGSSGDSLDFKATYIFHDGRFHNDCAVFALVRIGLPFHVLKVQHFVRSRQRMVVTGAIPARRIVTEINGRPAAREYARMVGLAVDRLTPQVFAATPVVVKIGEEDFVRSIQRVNDDESLTFFCAIDIGIVLTVARGVDTIAALEQAFAAVRADIGEPQLVIGCDCILRRLEFANSGQTAAISRILAENRVIGFSTYGEQYNGMHVNQTLTGLAIGYPTGNPAGVARGDRRS